LLLPLLLAVAITVYTRPALCEVLLAEMGEARSGCAQPVIECSYCLRAACTACAQTMQSLAKSFIELWQLLAQPLHLSAQLLDRFDQRATVAACWRDRQRC
jgi:hypothetical protein